MRVLISRRWLNCAVLFGFVLCGCGKSGPKMYEVHGKVTLDGEPVPTGTVMYIPDPSGPYATAEIGVGGTYKLHAIAGAHKVAVSAIGYPNGPEQSPVQYAPDRYSSEQTSGLTADVKPDADNLVDLALVNASKAKPKK